MRALVNGQERELTDGTTVLELVRDTAPSEKGIAVAVNSEVVPRSTWSDRSIAPGDSVEILTAVGGG